MALGKIAQGIAGFFGGDTGKELVGFIRDRWPAKLSDAELAEIEHENNRLEFEREQAAMRWANEQDAAFFQFTKEMEGTASDLKGVPLLGPIVIFMRGMFRPIFAYFTMYLDFTWFTTDTSHWTEQQNMAMIVINIIVLVFFFGERTVKNLLPMIAQVFGAKANG